MTPEQKQTWADLVELCQSNRFNSINVASQVRRTVILAMDAEVRRGQAAITEMMKFNRLRNDRDAYLLAMAEWGLKGKWGVDEEFSEQPKRADFGLAE